ncbi:MAG: type IX secretion system outer membrane channel protein PorV [Bacteroidaceae bacterium]|nr:type IX secretion system outer membrane channel protein PorV [Bacteroidaceae bacterium]
MKNKITRLLMAAGLIMSVQTLHAQKEMFNPVYTGVTSLSIAPDSRAGAMGDVGCATDPYMDNNSQYWNPSKYPFTNSQAGVSLCYTPWLRKLVSDIDLANLTGYYKLDDNSALSGSLTYFSLGEVFVSVDGGQTIGNFAIHPYEMAIDFDYSRKLSQNLSAAVGMRFIYSDLQYNYDDDVFPGKAFSADISMFYQNYIGVGRRDCLLGLGINASNIGSKISYDGGQTNEFIPTNLRVGASLTVPIDEYNSFAICADANKLMVPTQPKFEQFIKKYHPDLDPDDSTVRGQYASDYASWLAETGYNELSPIAGIFKSFSDAPGGFEEELREIYWGVGAEYNYNDQFFLRGGYHYENEYKGNRKYFTVGAGFHMNVFSLDAAYLISTAQSNPLDQTLRFTLSFDMDGIKQIFGR